MRKIFTGIIAVLCIICLCACNQERTSNSNQITEDRMYVTFEEALKLSTNILIAEFEKSFQYETESEYKFKVLEQLKGNTDSDIIYVNAINSNVTISDIDVSFNNAQYYNVGEKYLLVLERHISVYYEHDKYISFADVNIPLGDIENSQMYRQDIHKHSLQNVFTDSENLKSYIFNIIDSEDNSIREYWGTEFTGSDVLEEYVEKAQYVADFIPRSLLSTTGIDGTEIFECEIKQIYKGEINADTVLIMFFENTIEIGNEYTAALCSKGEDCVFALSSRNALATNQESRNELLNAVK